MSDEMNGLLQWMHGHGTAHLSPGLSRHHTTHMVTPGKEGGELNLPGLYGRHGVLPDYFTDELLNLGEDQDAMRDFLDIFNGRIFEMIYAIWRRYSFLTENALGADEEQGEAFYLNRLAGLLAKREMPLHLKGLRWNKLGIYRKKVRTREGLMALVSTFFPDLDVNLQTFVAVERVIPQSQRPTLGNGLRLGEEGNLLTGKTIMDPCGGIRLCFNNLNYEAYMNLLPNGPWRAMLAELVGDFTKNERDCMVQLELRADQVPSWRLGERTTSRDMWLLTGAAPSGVSVDAGRL